MGTCETVVGTYLHSYMCTYSHPFSMQTEWWCCGSWDGRRAEAEYKRSIIIHLRSEGGEEGEKTAVCLLSFYHQQLHSYVTDVATYITEVIIVLWESPPNDTVS